MENIPTKEPVTLVWVAQEKLPPLAWVKSALLRVELLVVLDGICPDISAYEALGVRFLRHPVALGHGRSIKTALNDVLLRHPAGAGVLLCGSESAPPLPWLEPMMNALQEHPLSLSLGYAPPGGLRGRAWWDRCFAPRIFSLVNGNQVQDVRAPLQAIPASLCPHFAVAPGEDDTYQLKALLSAKSLGIPLQNIALPALPYEAGFMSARQWLSMARQLLGFLGASLFSALVDYSVFTLLWVFAAQVVTFCTVGARVCSSMVNYLVNKQLVFKDQKPNKNSFIRYYILVMLLLLLNILAIKLFQQVLHAPVLLSKLLADVSIYCISYLVQRDVVFQSRTRKAQK